MDMDNTNDNNKDDTKSIRKSSDKEIVNSDKIDVKEDSTVNNNTNGANDKPKDEDIVKLYEELERYKREKQR